MLSYTFLDLIFLLCDKLRAMRDLKNIPRNVECLKSFLHKFRKIPSGPEVLKGENLIYILVGTVPV